MWAQQHLEKTRFLTCTGSARLIVLSIWWLSTASFSDAATQPEPAHQQLLPGDRVLLGTVKEIRSDQARIDTGELQSRFIPMEVRKAKGLPELKVGNRIELTVNEQNLLVDVHMIGESSHHSVVRGQLAEPLETGHDKAVLRTAAGKEESHLIRPREARSPRFPSAWMPCFSSTSWIRSSTSRLEARRRSIAQQNFGRSNLLCRATSPRSRAES